MTNTLHIVRLFNLDVSRQRIESTHISSNMAKLSRLGLFVRVIENFLYKLKKINPEAYKTLLARFDERYGQCHGYFADDSRKKIKHRLGESAQDICYLFDRLGDDSILSSLKVMAHLKGVFEEQCEVRKMNDDVAITVNAPEDVVYGYKGRGYEATFSETCSENNLFQVITDP